MTPPSTHCPDSASSIIVPELPDFDYDDWLQIETAFLSASALHFTQNWRDGLEPGFRAGSVKMGWNGEKFLVFAQIKDDLVTTNAAARNEMLYALGDVFETFAGVKGNPAYIEYHVAPNNIVLQLAFPDANALKSGVAIGTFFRVENESVLKARKVAGGWEAFVAIPKSQLPGADGPLKGQEWEVSFGRYDYGEEGAAPVLSSTSLLTELNFHRRMEWRSIRFE